jgi:hypothetical protein
MGVVGSILTLQLQPHLGQFLSHTLQILEINLSFEAIEK